LKPNEVELEIKKKFLYFLCHSCSTLAPWSFIYTVVGAKYKNEQRNISIVFFISCYLFVCLYFI